MIRLHQYHELSSETEESLRIASEEKIDLLINAGAKPDKISRLPGILTNFLKRSGLIFLGSFPTVVSEMTDPPKKLAKANETLQDLLAKDPDRVIPALDYSGPEKRDIGSVIFSSCPMEREKPMLAPEW